jgi:hypothetical protein
MAARRNYLGVRCVPKIATRLIELSVCLQDRHGHVILFPDWFYRKQTCVEKLLVAIAYVEIFNIGLKVILYGLDIAIVRAVAE